MAFQAHPSRRLRGYHDEKATIDTCKRPRRFLPRPGVDRARKSRRIPLSCLGNERFPSTRIRRSIAAAFQRTRFSPGYHDEQRRDDHDGGTRSGVSSWPAHTFVRERKTEKGWREKVAEERRQRERKKNKGEIRVVYWPANLPGGTHIQIMVMTDRFPLRRSLSPLFLLVDGLATDGSLWTYRLFASNCSWHGYQAHLYLCYFDPYCNAIERSDAREASLRTLSLDRKFRCI